MVFRGKPSKACQRCRDRKLRCNLTRPNCSSCLRVGAECHGYRDTDTLRISDETQMVLSKANSTMKTSPGSKQKSDFSINFSHLPLDIQIQARELFYAYYISDFSRAWDFLYPFFAPGTGPEHLALSIDAVSLAFLSHHFTSPTAQTLGRRKYISALRKVNKVLQSPETAQETTTLESSLLLDLFEKLTNPRQTSDMGRRAHVDGALALVRLRGLHNFTDEGGLKALTRLSLNTVIICISGGQRVPEVLYDIRRHTSKYVDVTYPKWRLTAVTLEIVDMASDIKSGLLGGHDKVQRCIELDQKLEVINREAPPKWWTYRRVYVDREKKTDRTLDGFYDIYDSRMETQMWNVLRIMRILLRDEIIQSCSGLRDEASQRLCQQAFDITALMVQEICASVPHMTDCEDAAKDRLMRAPMLSSHTHTMSHFLDTYVLLFSLYIAAWSRGCPPRAKRWIICQLERIASHFEVKEASTVAAVLKVQDEKARKGPWEIYRYLGSYAFAA